MDIIPNNINQSLPKSGIEAVENEQDEYKLIGKFRRTKGLRLFAYNASKDKIYEVEVDHTELAKLVFNGEQLQPERVAAEEVTVDGRHTHFEALNIKSATKRLNRFKDGKIKDLCNLKSYNPDGIKLY